MLDTQDSTLPCPTAEMSANNLILPTRWDAKGRNGLAARALYQALARRTVFSHGAALRARAVYPEEVDSSAASVTPLH